MKRSIKFLLTAVAVVLGMTRCDEFKSLMDNPVNSYLEVRQTELYLQKGESVMLNVHTISDAVVTYTVADESIAKVEKMTNLDAKVTGVKTGVTEVTVTLAANDTYTGGEVKVKVVVKPTVTLADAVKDGGKLKIAYKLEGEDCVLAYEYDANKQVFNRLVEDCIVPEKFGSFEVSMVFDGANKITHKVVTTDDFHTVLLDLNLYTAGSFDRVCRVPVELKSVQVNDYDLLPYIQESVTPVQGITITPLEDLCIGEKRLLLASVSPQNASNQVLKWTTSDATIASIDDEGLLKAHKAGTFTLKAEATDGSGTFAETEITAYVPKFLAWNDGQQKLIAIDFTETYTTVENANTNVEWAAGTYVVGGNVTINGNISLSGDVDLIIKDDAKLTVNKISGNIKNLSIYGQDKMTGELVVNCSDYDAITSLSTLKVHSAKVTASSSGSYHGGFYQIGTFNVYGGLVDAKGTAAIGYGIDLNEGGSMNIYGGEVKAEGKGNSDAYSCGILGENTNNKATVTVYGGKLWAGSADKTALPASYVTLQKGAGFTGKIYTSDDGTSWTEYTEAATPGTKYVKVE